MIFESMIAINVGGFYTMTFDPATVLNYAAAAERVVTRHCSRPIA